jgi:hypothetical protein
MVPPVEVVYKSLYLPSSKIVDRNNPPVVPVGPVGANNDDGAAPVAPVAPVAPIKALPVGPVSPVYDRIALVENDAP